MAHEDGEGRADPDRLLRAIETKEAEASRRGQL